MGDFNPRSPRGLRHTAPPLAIFPDADFNPRSPRGLRPKSYTDCTERCYNFNPRSPRGLRLRYEEQHPIVPIEISIHAAQEGCDFGTRNSTQSFPLRFQSTQPKRAATQGKISERIDTLLISIHAAQEGCDRQSLSMRWNLLVFQSTQPKRAATAASARRFIYPYYFNPRSPRGLRPKANNLTLYPHKISIHAAQEGCD